MAIPCIGLVLLGCLSVVYVVFPLCTRILSLQLVIELAEYEQIMCSNTDIEFAHTHLIMIGIERVK